VDYLLPTTAGVPLEVRGSVKTIKGRRAVVEARVLAEGKICAKGEVVVVQMPENMRPGR
jgi:acyl-CoA thioesterase FadM